MIDDLVEKLWKLIKVTVWKLEEKGRGSGSLAARDLPYGRTLKKKSFIPEQFTVKAQESLFPTRLSVVTCLSIYKWLL